MRRLRGPLRRRWAGVLAAAVGAATLAAGCGLPTDHSPRAIPRSAVRDVMSNEAQVGEFSQGQPASVTVTLYFPNRRIIAALPRGLPDRNVRTVIEALLAGPTRLERSRGVSTYIPPRTQLLSVDLPPSGVLIVELSKAINGVTGASARYAYAQLVLTLTLLPGVKAVSFRTEGHRVEVPTDQGSRTVVQRTDYHNPVRTS